MLVLSDRTIGLHLKISNQIWGWEWQGLGAESVFGNGLRRVVAIVCRSVFLINE